MSRTIRVPNGIVTLSDIHFNCPKCKYEYNIEYFHSKIDKSKHYYIYMNCKGCKSRLGVTTNIKGDAVAWLKEDEIKELNK